MPLHLLVKWEVVSLNSREKKSGGGGGLWIFFLEKQFFLISRFMLFSILKKILKRDSWNLYPLFPCSDFVSQMWGWFGGGGGCNVFLTFYAISNISRKKIWEYKTMISHLMLSFFVCWKYCTVPLH